jgi:hypothetical protein
VSKHGLHLSQVCTGRGEPLHGTAVSAGTERGRRCRTRPGRTGQSRRTSVAVDRQPLWNERVVAMPVPRLPHRCLKLPRRVSPTSCASLGTIHLAYVRQQRPRASEWNGMSTYVGKDPSSWRLAIARADRSNIATAENVILGFIRYTHNIPSMGGHWCTSGRRWIRHLPLGLLSISGKPVRNWIRCRSMFTSAD